MNYIYFKWPMILLLFICMVNSYEIELKTVDNDGTERSLGANPEHVIATSGKPITLLCRPKSGEWNNCIWDLKTSTENITGELMGNIGNRTDFRFGEIKRSHDACIFRVNNTG